VTLDIDLDKVVMLVRLPLPVWLLVDLGRAMDAACRKEGVRGLIRQEGEWMVFERGGDGQDEDRVVRP
jgi:hypothetical protein